MRFVELRRHTDSDGDALTSKGVEAAVEIGCAKENLYDVVVSSGAQRATQTAACILAGLNQRVQLGVIVDEGFRSEQEDRWREIYSSTGSGDLGSFLEADREFVTTECDRFVEALRRTVVLLPDGGRALVIGHSPMLEACAWRATGEEVAPLGKGEAVALVEDDGAYRLER